MDIFSVKEAAEITGIPTRTIHYMCKRDNVRKKSNRYQITQELLSLWMDKKTDELQLSRNKEELAKELAKLTEENASLKKELQDLKEISKKELQIDLKKAIEIISLEAVRQGVTHKIFTNQEFEEIIGTIALSEQQEEQIQYLRNRIAKQDEALITIAKQVEQRNYIEAMDKGYNTPK